MILDNTTTELKLSITELELVRLKCKGLLNKEVAYQRHRSLFTVRTEVGTLYKKLKVHNIGELVSWAYEHHIINVEQ